MRGVWLVCGALLAAAPSLWASSKALPAWALAAVDPQAAYERIDPEAKGLVVWDRRYLTYTNSGELRTRVQRALHIRSREERALASFVVYLSDKSSKVLRFGAWMRYPSGNVEVFGRNDLVEVAADLEALASEARFVTLDRSASVRDGTVVAFEWEVEEKGVFTQELLAFQESAPVVYSRIDVTGPAGWTIHGVLLGGSGVTTENSGNSAFWEARDLPLIKSEPGSLPWQKLAAQVGITALPPEGSSKTKRLRPFRSWNELARYGAEVQGDRIVPDEAIRAQARVLADGAGDRWSVLQRVSSFAQAINYVSINLDIGNGGGYAPRAAREVFAKGYGDCKDMTGLTRSLLGALGIESYAALSSVGPGRYVDPIWPSPLQFDHCIVAIPVDGSIRGPAVVEDPKLGRLLIFDPTQRFAPLGELPFSLQGTKILVAGDGVTELLQLPLLGGERDAERREIDVSIGPKGELSGTVREFAFGAYAEQMRALRRSSSDEDFRKLIRAWMERGLGEVAIESLTWEDRFEQHEFEIAVSFRTERYGRWISKNSVTFRPVFLQRVNWAPPSSEKRQSDFVSMPRSSSERVRFRFPEGFALDSRRDSSGVETSFLNYRLEFRDVDGGLEVDRSIETRYEVLAKGRYGELVRAYEEMARAESAPVILSAGLR